MSGHKRNMEIARNGKEKLSKLSNYNSDMIDDIIKIENQDEFLMEMGKVEKLVQYALEAKTKDMRTLVNEKVESLWKNHNIDLKAKDDQIENMKKGMEYQNKIILKLREELKMKEKEVEEDNAIINEAERKHREISKINTKLSEELRNKSRILNEKEIEMEDIKKKYKLREDNIKELAHVIMKSKQSITKLTKESLAEIFRLSKEVKVMKETNTFSDDENTIRKKVKEIEETKNEEINNLKKSIYEMKASMKVYGASHNETCVTLQQRYQMLLKAIMKRKLSKKGNFSLHNSYPEVTDLTEDDDIMILSDNSNKPNNVLPNSDIDKPRSFDVQISESVSKDVTKNYLYDNPPLIVLDEDTEFLTSNNSSSSNNVTNNLMSASQITTETQMDALDTVDKKTEKEHIANETVTDILNEILQKVEEIKTEGSMNIVHDTREVVNDMPDVLEEMPENLELNNVCEAGTVRVEEEDVIL